MSDYWEKSDQVFVCDGQRYGIAANGATVCQGKVENPAVKNTTPAVIQNTPQQPPVTQQAVSKIPARGKLHGETFSDAERIFLKQGGRGRPKVIAGGSRTTRYRRRLEEKQLALNIK